MPTSPPPTIFCPQETQAKITEGLKRPRNNLWNNSLVTTGYKSWVLVTRISGFHVLPRRKNVPNPSTIFSRQVLVGFSGRVPLGIVRACPEH